MQWSGSEPCYGEEGPVLAPHHLELLQHCWEVDGAVEVWEQRLLLPALPLLACSEQAGGWGGANWGGRLELDLAGGMQEACRRSAAGSASGAVELSATCCPAGAATNAVLGRRTRPHLSCELGRVQAQHDPLSPRCLVEVVGHCQQQRRVRGEVDEAILHSCTGALCPLRAAGPVRLRGQRQPAGLPACLLIRGWEVRLPRRFARPPARQGHQMVQLGRHSAASWIL